MFIDFELDEVLQILSQKIECKDMTKDEIIELVPRSVDRDILIDFYLKTGLTVRHYLNDQNGERTLLFDRLGAYPVWDMGFGAYLKPSGDYALAGGDIDMAVDIIVEEEVQLISQSDDGKNYIIVPFGVDLYEEENDYDIDSEEYSNLISGENGPRIRVGFDFTRYLVPIASK